jgi:DNA-binding response OmpR family regulator
MTKKKILVADDDSAIVDVLQILLEDQGYEVLATLNAEDIEALMKKGPDMVLLDIWMSGVNGKDICMKIKAKDTTKDIPVIMFSANRDTKDIALQCGADGFICKPFEINELIDIVKKFTDKPEPVN